MGIKEVFKDVLHAILLTPGQERPGEGAQSGPGRLQHTQAAQDGQDGHDGHESSRWTLVHSGMPNTHDGIHDDAPDHTGQPAMGDSGELANGSAATSMAQRIQARREHRVAEERARLQAEALKQQAARDEHDRELAARQVRAETMTALVGQEVGLLVDFCQANASSQDFAEVFGDTSQPRVIARTDADVVNVFLGSRKHMLAAFIDVSSGIAGQTTVYLCRGDTRVNASTSLPTVEEMFEPLHRDQVKTVPSLARNYSTSYIHHLYSGSMSQDPQAFVAGLTESLAAVLANRELAQPVRKTLASMTMDDVTAHVLWNTNSWLKLREEEFSVAENPRASSQHRVSRTLAQIPLLNGLVMKLQTPRSDEARTTLRLLDPTMVANELGGRSTYLVNYKQNADLAQIYARTREHLTPAQLAALEYSRPGAGDAPQA